jgi:hypothetical protein
MFIVVYKAQSLRPLCMSSPSLNFCQGLPLWEDTRRMLYEPKTFVDHKVQKEKGFCGHSPEVGVILHLYEHPHLCSVCDLAHLI